MEPQNYLNDDPSFLPFLKHALEDIKKNYGDKWFKVLTLAVDPLDKYVLITKVIITPARAQDFLKKMRSSVKQ